MRTNPDTLHKLSAKELAALHHDGSFWTWTDKLAPTDAWRHWMGLDRRGFGKIRTGAEWMRAMSKVPIYVTLVGATANGARTIRVEGESDVLNVYPDSEQPEYMAHNSELHWPNGTEFHKTQGNFVGAALPRWSG